MNFRNLLALISMTLLMAASACSTSDSAQTGQDNPGVEDNAQAQNPGMADNSTPASEADSSNPANPTTERQQMMAHSCPMQVAGTTRQVVKLDDAVAMDFKTTGDVDELRTRVQNMAQKRGQMHGQMHGEQGQHGQHGQQDQMHGQHGQMHGEQGQMKQGQMHGKMTDQQRQMRRQMMQMMSDVTVSTQEIGDGMRVVLTPNDASQADALYQMMEKQSEMMGEQGQCPMQMMGGGPMEEDANP